MSKIFASPFLAIFLALVTYFGVEMFQPINNVLKDASYRALAHNIQKGDTI